MIARAEETNDSKKKGPSYGRSPKGPSSSCGMREEEMVDASMSGGGWDGLC